MWAMFKIVKMIHERVCILEAVQTSWELKNMLTYVTMLKLNLRNGLSKTEYNHTTSVAVFKIWVERDDFL